MLQARKRRAEAEKPNDDVARKSSKVEPEVSNPSVVAGATQTIPPGTILVGRVLETGASSGKLSGVLVQFRHGLQTFTGRVDITHITDVNKWTSFPMESVQSGRFVKCVALKRVPNSVPPKFVELSMRPSLIDNASLPEALKEELEEAMALPAHDSIATGFVVNSNEKGCFIRLTRALTARVLLKNLAQGFVKDVGGEFPPGKLVAGRVVSVDNISNRVELTLRPSAVVSESERKHAFASLTPGSKIDGTVHRVIRSGILINVGDGSGITGFCHLSEAFDEDAVPRMKSKGKPKGGQAQDNIDERRHDLAIKTFRVGDIVRCLVLEVDMEQSKVKLGLRPSYFGDEMEDENEANPESGPSEAAEDDVSQASDDDEELPDDEADEQGEESSEDTEDAPAQALSLQDALKLAAGGEIDDDQVGEDVRTQRIVQKGSSVGVEANYDEGQSLRNLNGKRKDAVKRRDEMETAELEERLAADAEPQTEEEFERVLVFKGDSSLVWIKYISMYVSVGDMDKARAVGERALKTIPAERETERNNVWSALLTMELQFGSLDAAKTLFARMVRVSEEKWAYLTLCDAYDSLPSTFPDRRNLAEEAIRGAKKASKQRSAKVWIRHFKLEFDNEDAQTGRKLLKEALRLLPAHKHIKVMLAFARLEFSHPLGDVERARTVFGGILENFPKKTDIWHVYIDLEAKYGSATHVRHLFERALSTKMSPKSTKALFKKWLLFESGSKGGGAAAVEEVKRRAREYVASLVRGDDDENDE